jgi:hypothetical protein
MCCNNDEDSAKLTLWTSILFMTLTGLMGVIFLNSCSLTLQTISTEGEAKNLVDDVQETKADIPITGFKPK